MMNLNELITILFIQLTDHIKPALADGLLKSQEWLRMGHELHLAQKGIYQNHSRFHSDSQHKMRSEAVKKIKCQLKCNKVEGSSLGSTASSRIGESGSSDSSGSSNSSNSRNLSSTASLTFDNPCSLPASVSLAIPTAGSKVCTRDF